MKPVNEILKARRIELGYTVDKLGEIVGVNGSTISRWERGEIDNMRRDKIVILAKALKISPMVIIEKEGEETCPKKLMLLAQEMMESPLRKELFVISKGLEEDDLLLVIRLIKRMLKQ